MFSGGWEIWGYDVGISYLDDNIADAVSAVYDNFLGPAGGFGETIVSTAADVAEVVADEVIDSFKVGAVMSGAACGGSSPRISAQELVQGSPRVLVEEGTPGSGVDPYYPISYGSFWVNMIASGICNEERFEEHDGWFAETCVQNSRDVHSAIYMDLPYDLRQATFRNLDLAYDSRQATFRRLGNNRYEYTGRCACSMSWGHRDIALANKTAEFGALSGIYLYLARAWLMGTDDGRNCFSRLHLWDDDIVFITSVSTSIRHASEPGASVRVNDIIQVTIENVRAMEVGEARHGRMECENPPPRQYCSISTFEADTSSAEFTCENL